MTKVQPVVWVIDDEELNRILACAYLEMLGWEVKEFSSGKDVLSSLKKQRPQAMLVDVRMPGLTGDELVRQIREIYAGQDLRIVAYTAHCMEEMLEEIKSAGFDHVLIKPVSLKQMSDALPVPIGAPTPH